MDIGWGDEALAIGHDGCDLRNVDYVDQVVETGTTAHFKPHGTMVRRVGAIYDEVTDSRISKESQKSESVPRIRFRRFYRFIIRSLSKCSSRPETRDQRALVRFYATHICLKTYREISHNRNDWSTLEN